MSNNESDMNQPVTRGELREELQLLEQRLEQRLAIELRRHVNAVMEQSQAQFAVLLEQNKSQIAAVDKKYEDLPGRVEKLEQERETPKPRRRRAAR
jgi:hypothetical protein